ncbi:DUF1501 domain-containing protein [Pendulispora rubella]|uniref:DUF1501 domain-containing protein n=1 Tax=Pendulispora rubella TaxID=2741070 RepID=A0ABZ2L0H5_9BACT
MRKDETRKPMHFTRRDLLRSVMTLTAAGFASRLGFPALAQAAAQVSSTRRFVFCYFPGGWDQLLFLDPRDPTANGKKFDDENRANTLTETRYASLDGHNGFSSKVVTAGNLTFGPAVEKANSTLPKLTKHYQRLAIVRGINMGTLGHEVGYRYFLTAKFPAGNTARGTSLATEAAAQMQSPLPLPALSLRVESYNEHRPGQYSAMRVDSIDDLLMVLERGKDLLERDAVEEALTDYAKQGAPCAVNVYDRRGLLTRMRGTDGAARATLSSKLANKFRFPTGKDDLSAAVRQQYGLNRGEAASSAARAAFAAQAIKEQVAQCVSVAIGGGTDTHFLGNGGHADALHPGIAAFAALIDDLAKSPAPPELQRLGGDSWLDHTTLLAFSEFARTPMFNTFGGRDHHLTSSCLLAGAGIVGNQVVGASGDVGMGPGRYDFKTRRTTSQGGENIKPEHVAATLLASAGLDPGGALIREEPLRVLVAG